VTNVIRIKPGPSDIQSGERWKGLTDMRELPIAGPAARFITHLDWNVISSQLDQLSRFATLAANGCPDSRQAHHARPNRRPDQTFEPKSLSGIAHATIEIPLNFRGHIHRYFQNSR
jgi:hypothetical protein